MTEQQQRDRQDQNQDQQDQQEQQSRSQASFDNDFSSLISSGTGQPDAAREAWQAYFDLAEQTLRSARRVSEVQTLSLMRQQIVNEVTNQVISAIRQNPQLIRRSSSSSSSSS